MHIAPRYGYAFSVAAALAILAAPLTASANATHPLNSQALGVRPSVTRMLPPSILLPRVAGRLHPVTGQVRGVNTHPDASQAYIYTCDYYGSDCKVWNSKTYALVSTVTNGLSNPQGTSVNWNPARRTWYIANTGLSNVLALSPGGSSVVNTINDSGQYPVDVTAAFKGTNVYISNIYTTSFTAGSLSVCSGSGSCSQLTDPNAFEGIGVAVDSNGNCFWSYNDNSGIGQIDEFAGCKGSPTNLGLSLGFAGGVAVDQAGDLWYSDQLAGVYKCTGTTGCALFASGFSDGLMINFAHKYANLLVADAGAGNVDSVNPTTGAVTTLFSPGTSDPPFGVAASPGTKY
jgi:hypothetical protein